MKRFLFIRLVAVLTCFVAGGLMAGVAVAGAKMNMAKGSVILADSSDDDAGGELVVRQGETGPEVVVNMVGDVLLASGVDTAIAANGPDYPWQDTGRLLRQADLTIANLECSISNRGEPVPEKEYTFRARPDAIKGAVNAGVDIFALANNHTMDYGVDALMDTMRIIRENNIFYVGAGASEGEAVRPVILERKGFKIAVLSFSRVVPWTDWIAGRKKPGLASGYNTKLMLDSLRSAAEKSDITIIYMHWGQELDDYPNQEEINLAHRLVDAGADVVIGCHPHVLQGMEIYKGKLIAYSLGNFIFTSSSTRAREGAILQVAFNSGGENAARIIPTYISGGSTSILRGSDRKRVLSRLEGLSAGFGANIQENGSLTHLTKESGVQ